MTPKLVISIGDINGIGPEVILKSLIDHDYSEFVPIVVSPFEVAGYYSDTLDIPLDINYCRHFDDISLGRINVFWDDALPVKLNRVNSQLQVELLRWLLLKSALNLLRMGMHMQW